MVLAPHDQQIVAIALFPLFAYSFDGYRHSPRVLATMYLTSAMIIVDASGHDISRRPGQQMSWFCKIG